MKRNYPLEQYLLVGTLVGLFFWVTYPILSAVFLGLFLAMVLHPWHKKLSRHSRISNTVSAFLLTTATIVCILLPIIYVGIIVTKDASNLADYLMSLTNPSTPNAEQFSMNHYMDLAYGKVPDWLSVSRVEFENLVRRVLASSGNILGKILGGAALSVPELLLNLLFIVMALFYGMVDGSIIGKYIRDLLPFTRSEVETFTTTSQSIVEGVVVGSLLAGLVQGLIIFLGFVTLGVPRPLFFAVMTLIFSFVPVLGSLPAGIGGAVYLFIMGRTGAGVAMIVVFILASTADNVVKPLALKGQSELHPLIGLIAVIGGLAVFGFSGLFLGPLAAALAIVALDILRDNRLGSNHESTGNY